MVDTGGMSLTTATDWCVALFQGLTLETVGKMPTGEEVWEKR